MVMILPFISFLAQWNQSITFPESLSSIEDLMRLWENKAQRITEAFLLMRTPLDLLINGRMIALTLTNGLKVF